MRKTTTMKRIASIAAAAAMTACMAMPMMTAWADEAPKTTITVTDTQATATTTYKAYQLMTATVDSAAGAYTYTINDTYLAAMKSAAGVTEADAAAAKTAVMTYIQGLNDAGIRTFANTVYKNILAAGITTPYEATHGQTGEVVNTTATFTDMPQGYYLVAQVAANSEVDAATSLVMVDTAGDEELPITVKKQLPEFDKQIGDINDTAATASADWNAADYTWSEDADHDKYAKDAVPFRLIATLPADYANYDHYTLKFHDDLQAAVYDVSSVAIKDVYIGTKAQDGTITKVADIDGAKYEKGEGCGTDHDGEDSTHADGCDFTVTIADLKDAAASATKDNVVVVEYTAKFTDATIVGSAGNWNTALLEYSNNPYNTGSGASDNTTSKTAPDAVVAFTYQVDINKVKEAANGTTTSLAGAAFKLEKKTAEVDGEGNPIYETVREYTVADNKTTFNFIGLDDGDYRLTETVVPAGYNGIDPIEFTVTAEHSGEALVKLNGVTEDGEITLVGDQKASVDFEDGTITADILNKSGQELPSTGGIGTTLFYVVGGTMAAGAGVYLISKKRMKNNEQD